MKEIGPRLRGLNYHDSVRKQQKSGDSRDIAKGVRSVMAIALRSLARSVDDGDTILSHIDRRIDPVI